MLQWTFHSLIRQLKNSNPLRIGSDINRACLLLFILALTLFACIVQNQVYAAGVDAAAKPPLYGMVVTGKRPGPPLWKVTNQDNVLWVFGTLRHLPKKLRWDPVSVRYILSEATQYISPPQVSASESNPFKAYALMRRLSKLQQNPDGKTLQDVLPEDLYARFLEAKSIYAPRDKKILNLRPMEASDRLISAARESVGLSYDAKVSKKLRSIARGRGATLIDHKRSVEVEVIFQAYANITLQDELACLEIRLETIRTDLEATVVRANAWANGNADLLLRLDYPDPDAICFNIMDSDEFKQLRIEWFESIQNALSNNSVSLANFPMREIVHPEGLLAQLRQQGYIISRN